MVTENPKTLKILSFYRFYTKAWPKIWKLWVNLEKCERRKIAIPIRFTKVNNNLFSEMNYKKQAHFVFIILFISITCSWDILQFYFKKSVALNLKQLGLPYLVWININFMIYWTWSWKILDLPCCSRFDFRYIGLGLKKCSDNLTGVRLILWYIGLGLKDTFG